MSQIGRYEIVRQTGNHGLGSLYQAFDPVMHRPVMIRVADRTDQERQAVLFDAKQLAHLDHPNIIKFLACEEDDGRPVPESGAARIYTQLPWVLGLTFAILGVGGVMLYRKGAA